MKSLASSAFCKIFDAPAAIATASLLMLASAVLPGRASTWTGGGANTSWSTSGNWNGGVPSSTSGTSNTNTANFNSAGTNGQTLSLDQYAAIGYLDFGYNAYSGSLGSETGYTINAGGGTFYLDTTSNIGLQIDGTYTGVGTTTSINAPIVFENANGIIANWTFASSNDNLALGGTISTGVANGAGSNFILYGFGGGAITAGDSTGNTISGAIQNGTANTATAAIATFANNSNTITVTNNSGLAVGQALTGTGIGTGAYITNINGTTITLSAATTQAVSTAESLTIASDPMDFTVVDAGSTWTLSGNNTYTGYTSINSGTVILNFGSDATGTTQRISDNELTIGGTGGNGNANYYAYPNGGGTLIMQGSTAAAEDQKVTSITIAGGYNEISLVENGYNTELQDTGALSRNVTSNTAGAALLDVSTTNTAAKIGATNTTTLVVATNNLTTTNNILVGVTTNLNDWAQANSVSGGYSIVPFNGTFLNTWGTTTTAQTDVNASTGTSGSPVTNGTTNSVRFNNSSSDNGDTVYLSGTNLITSGQILVTSAVGANASAILGGTLEAGTGASGELIVYQNNTTSSLGASAFTISSNIDVNNLDKAGLGSLILTGTSSAISELNIEGGIVQIGATASKTSYSLGSGTSVVFSDDGTDSTLDLHGNNLSVANVYSSRQVTNENQFAATSGFAPNVTNLVAGTQSDLILTNANTSNTSALTLTQGSGGVLGVSVTGGTFGNIGFYINNSSGTDVDNNSTLPNVNYDLISGAIEVSSGGTYSLSGQDDFLTTGAVVLDGGTLGSGGSATVAGTYFVGTSGTFNASNTKQSIDISHSGSVTDTATGITALGGAFISDSTGTIVIPAIAGYNLASQTSLGSTATVTSGSASITVSSTSGISIGTVLYDYQGAIPNGDYVTAISGTTLTLAVPTTGTYSSDALYTNPTYASTLDSGGTGTLSSGGVAGPASVGVEVDGTAKLVLTGSTNGTELGAGNSFAAYLYGAGTVDVAPATTSPGTNLVVSGLNYAGPSGTANDTVNAFASGATTVTVTSTTGLFVGGAVSGTNIASGTYITQISGNTLTLSLPTSGMTSGTENLTYNTYGGYDQVYMGGGATLELNKGTDTSLEVTLGFTADGIIPADSTAVFSRQARGTLIIKPDAGLASLGTSTGESLVVLGTSAAAPADTNGIVAPYIVGEDTNGYGDFLHYAYTNGTASDAGFQDAYGNINANQSLSLAAASATQTVELVSGNSPTSTQTTVAATGAIYALRSDVNVSIGAGYTLTLNSGGLILNGGAGITSGGAGATLAAGGNELIVYTNATSTIGTVLTGTNGLTKIGAGTLVLSGADTLSGALILNDGVLDISGAGSTIAGDPINLDGGVLQTVGTFTDTLYSSTNTSTDDSTNGTVFWSAGQNGRGGSVNDGGDGGFSAGASKLEVAIGGTGANSAALEASSTQLIWGTSGTNNLTFSFVSDGGVLLFGSSTSAAELQFDNPVSLGNVINGGFYDRIVSVATNATDAFGLVLPSALGGDSTATFNGDYTNMTGVISEPNYQFGFVKAGAGILQLSGANTYQGSTSVTGGILAISADANLGTAPSNAYPLVTVPDSVTGSTLTPGAIQIDGGTLAFLQGTSTANGNTAAAYSLSSNRSILLGPTANIDVVSNVNVSFGGLIGNYVGETGALTKVDAGTFTYGGTASYSGATKVLDGALINNGTIGGSGVAVLASGANNAVLGGTGTFTSAVTIGGAASAGAGHDVIDAGTQISIGKLTLSNGLSFVTGSASLPAFTFEINSTTGATDLLAITGGLTLGNGLASISGTDLGSGSFSTYILATTTTGISGTFAGYADDSLITVGSNVYTITYGQNGDGGIANDLELTAAPEPSVWALMAAGAVVLIRFGGLRRSFSESRAKTGTEDGRL